MSSGQSRKHIAVPVLTAALAALAAGPADAGSTPVAGYSASWWSQINLTPAIEATANYASGFALGFVDTGVIANNAELAGRVSSASSCAAVTFRCRNGVYDDNGHGTAVAAIAAGSTVTGGWMSGVAPGATIISEKVLNAAGSGYDTDVANGIVQAANAGAKVINLSIGSGSSTPILADPTMAAAVNYAASKGVVMVWAGGNSSLNYSAANITGLTAAAIQDTVLVGSVNAANVKSSFSNAPGSASFVATNGQKTTISSQWLMAPGENIVAPGIMYGANAYAYWTGTSMAAPMVSGALALLETEWPVLARNDTGPAVLYATATDLGAKGVDATYGKGLLNIGAAFQPVGTLTVTNTKGAVVAVSSLTPSILTGGALGSLSSLSAMLANYTAFDSFQRNFLVNLSGLIARAPSETGAQAAAAARAPQTVGTATHFADGSSFSFIAADDPSQYETSAAKQYFLAGNLPTMSAQTPPPAWGMAFTDRSGRSVAAGSGLPATAQFAQSLWGGASPLAAQAQSLGIADGAVALANGGTYVALGEKIGADSRIAASFSSTSSLNPATGTLGSVPNPQINPALTASSAPGIVPSWQQPHADAAALGLRTSLGKDVTAGLTLGFLDEQQGLLGTTYQNTSPLSLGDQHRTESFGQSLGIDLGNGASLLLETMEARVEAASASAGLVTGTTPMMALAFGASLDQQHAVFAGDDISVSVRKPMRVFSGAANVAVTSVDSNGYATTSNVRVGLTPSGSQTDYNLGYRFDLGNGVTAGAVAGLSTDAGNVKGALDLGGSVNLAFHW